MVRKFLGLISSHNIPVYLIDPLILGLVDKDIEQIRSSPGGPSPECKYFCAPRDFTTFALLDKTWKHEVSAFFSVHICVFECIRLFSDFFWHSAFMFVLSPLNSLCGNLVKVLLEETWF